MHNIWRQSDMGMVHGVDQIEFYGAKSGTASAPDQSAVVQRLKESRASFLETVKADARETGTRWLREEATYEQIKCLAQISRKADPANKALNAEHVSSLRLVDKSIERLSKTPNWARNNGWYDGFVEAAIAEWTKIASQVERDD